MKKNERFTVTIEDMSENGEGIGKQDGYIWFVKDTIIGDVAEVSVMRMKKSYGFARLVRIITPSEYRAEPKCPVARQCGGCQIQAMNYQQQLKFKEQKVYDNLTRIGKFEQIERVEDAESLETAGGAVNEQETGKKDGEHKILFFPIMGICSNPWRYRNKAQFPFGKGKDGEIITGFYAGRTHAIIEQEDCLLGVEENKSVLGIIRTFMKEYAIEPYDETTHTGLVRHALIRKGFRTGEIMVSLVLNGAVKQLKSPEVLVSRLVEAVPGMTSISCSINKEKTNVIMGKELVNLYGPGYITDYIGEIKYHISPLLSFYQVNPVQTEKLYGTALEYAGLTGEEAVWICTAASERFPGSWGRKQQQVYGVEIWRPRRFTRCQGKCQN